MKICMKWDTWQQSKYIGNIFRKDFDDLHTYSKMNLNQCIEICFTSQSSIQNYVE